LNNNFQETSTESEETNVFDHKLSDESRLSLPRIMKNSNAQSEVSTSEVRSRKNNPNIFNQKRIILTLPKEEEKCQKNILKSMRKEAE
jgi:hypothetical protein